MAPFQFVPLSETNTIDRLYRLGHFHNPTRKEDVEGFNLTQLKYSDKIVKRAVRSMQNFMYDQLNEFSFEEHVREAIADGEIGPATKRLMKVDRCGRPDYEMSVQAGRRAGTRSSWPKGCHPAFGNHHTFAVYIDKSNMPGFLKPHFDKAWMLCRAAYADVGIWFFETQTKLEANTVVTWERGKGWIGLAIVPNNPGCGQRIWAKFDTKYQPRDMVNQWARLLAHEFCHNMGLSHTRGGIMNPSIVGGKFDRDEWRGDPSFPALKRFFGGNPINLGDEPDKPDPPVDNGDSIARPGPDWEHFNGSWAKGNRLEQFRGWAKES